MTAEAAAPLDRARALLGLLEQEANALRAGDGDALRLVCFDKIGHLRPLESLLAALAKGSAGIDAEQRNALAGLLRQCLRDTRRNGALLHSRMNRARNMLQLQRGAPAHYDASGSGRYEARTILRSVA